MLNNILQYTPSFEHIVSFSLGVIASLIATGMVAFINFLRNRRVSKLVGTWAEVVAHRKGARYSLGCIRKDHIRRMYIYTGTSYDMSGHAKTHWRTLASYVDVSRCKFFYIFDAELVSGPSHQGHGTLNLVERDGKIIPGPYLVPVDGTFESISVDGPSTSHSMINVTGHFKYLRKNYYPEFVDYMIANHTTPPP